MPIDSTSLTTNPRKIKVISTRSGHVIDLIDDGASINADGTFPNGHRQHTLAQAQKRHGHGGKGGPKVSSWVALEPIEPSSGNPKYDPAANFTTMKTRVVINDKEITYAQLIEQNMAKAAAASRDADVLAINEAKSRGATEEFIGRLNAIIDSKVKDALAAPAPTADPKKKEA